jgi:hypothetical protein
MVPSFGTDVLMGEDRSGGSSLGSKDLLNELASCQAIVLQAAAQETGGIETHLIVARQLALLDGAAGAAVVWSTQHSKTLKQVAIAPTEVESAQETIA